MTTAIADRAPDIEAIEQVLVNGDLAKLTPAQRVSYYNRMCQSLGLNPLTKPFDYIALNGKLVLYAKRDAAEQLRKIHGVSITDMQTQKFDDVYVVTVKAQDKTGRMDMSTGAVPLANLKGEALANALLKCETKAKRRVTLSICGLGMLDETEVESIAAPPAPSPDARLQVQDAAIVNTESGEQLPELPPGVHYLTGYKIQGEWHEADVLQWDLQGGALHISTKRAPLGNLMAKASNEHLPIRLTGDDITSKRNSPGCAYVNKISIYHPEVHIERDMADVDAAAHGPMVDESDIPF